MKLLVTGGSGKLGRAIVRDIAAGSDYTEIIVLDLGAGEPHEKVRYLLGDVTNLAHVVEAMQNVSAVLHLAGIPRTGVYTNEQTIRTNVTGAFNVFECAARLAVNKVVVMGSEAVLGWAPGANPKSHLPDYFPIDEAHPTSPQDAYGLSKKLVESIAESYSASFSIEAIVIRPPWVITPEELNLLRERKGVKPERFALFNYIDVRDLAEVCRRALKKVLPGFTVLFVNSGDTLSSEPLASAYAQLDVTLSSKSRVLKGSASSVSSKKARQMLDWAPRHTWRSS